MLTKTSIYRFFWKIVLMLGLSFFSYASAFAAAPAITNIADFVNQGGVTSGTTRFTALGDTSDASNYFVWKPGTEATPNVGDTLTGYTYLIPYSGIDMDGQTSLSIAEVDNAGAVVAFSVIDPVTIGGKYNETNYNQSSYVTDISPQLLVPSLINKNLILWQWEVPQKNGLKLNLIDNITNISVKSLDTNTNQYIETVLPNTQYHRFVRADDGEKIVDSNVQSVYSLPDNSDVLVDSVDADTLDVTLSSQNLSDGNVEYYVYEWLDANAAAPTLNCKTSPNQWTSGTLNLINATGEGYIFYHLSCNADQVAATEGQQSLNPYGESGIVNDTESPEILYMSLNFDSAYTNSQTIPVQFLSYDDVEVTEMIVTTDPSVDGGGVLTGASKETYKDFINSFDLGATSGTITVYAQVFDDSGKQSTVVSKSITVDTAAVTVGAITIKDTQGGSTIPADTWWSDDKPYFSWEDVTVGVSGIEGYSIRIKNIPNSADDGTFDPDNVIDTEESFYEYVNTELPAGRYVLKVKAKNRAGTWSAVSSVIFRTDAVLPTVTPTFPQDGKHYNQSDWDGYSGVMQGTASDANSGLQVLNYSLQQQGGNYWGGSAFDAATQTWLAVTGSTSWTLPAFSSTLSDGSYTLTIRARDNSQVSSGVYNEQLEVINFSIDTTAPSNPTIKPSTAIKVGSGSVTGVKTSIQGTLQPTIYGEAGAKAWVKVNSDPFTEYVFDSSGEYTLGSAVPMTVLEPTVSFYAEDDAGNTSETITAYYTYAATLTSISPTSLNRGDTLTLTGKNLGSASSTVTFTSAASATTIDSYTDNGDNTETITVTVPADAETGPVKVNSSLISGLESNELFLTVVKDPTGITVAPSGDESMNVGELKVFAAYAKDEDNNIVSDAYYIWHFSNITGAVKGVNPNGSTYNLTLNGGSNEVTTGIGSVMSLTTTEAGTGTMYVTLDTPYTSVNQAPDPAKIVTVYSSSSTSNSILACSSDGPIRVDFTSEDGGNPLGVDMTNTTSSYRTLKTYGSSSPVIAINDFEGAGTVISEDLYSGEADMQAVLLEANHTLENDADITYSVSFNADSAVDPSLWTWTNVEPGSTVQAPSAGTSVRWRAVMTGTNPILHWVRLTMSSTSTVSQRSLPAGEYVYAPANCSSSQYQVGTLEELDSGSNAAKVQGNYLIQGDKDNYVDPGPVGIYEGEIDSDLLRKYLNIQ